jgi:hypothetical protein
MNDCDSLRDRVFAPGQQRCPDPEWTEHLKICSSCRLANQALPLVDQGLFEMARLPVEVPPFELVAKAAKSAARNQRNRVKVRRSLPFFYTGLATAAVAASLVVAVMIGKGHLWAPKLLQPGTEIRATAEAKTVVLANGARIRLDVGTVKLTASNKAGQTLYLGSGRVFLEVPKLPQGSTLAVRTADAEVRVHGTRFQVVRTSDATQVHVVEGLVEVRPEGIGRPIQFVGAGDSLTVGSAEAYRESLRHSMLDALDRGEFTSAEKNIGALLGSSADQAQKAEVEALLAWTIAARGKRAEAISRYQQALTLLPAGLQALWAENACAELAILVEHETPKNANATWAECLRRFPSGVHADLARARSRSSKGM